MQSQMEGKEESSQKYTNFVTLHAQARERSERFLSS